LSVVESGRFAEAFEADFFGYDAVKHCEGGYC
jgi:hypothetical protein